MVASTDPTFPPPMETGTAQSSVRATGDHLDIELFWTLHGPADDGSSERRLLLINGLGSPLTSYDEGFVAEFVDRGFSVVRFDNRDIGRSSRVTETDGADGSRVDGVPYTLVDMASDAVAVLDAVGWDHADVLGQSMGGMIAQQLAISYPERVRSLISLMSSTGNGTYGRATRAAYEALIRPAPHDRQGWIEHAVETGRLWATPDSWDPDLARERAARKFDYGIDVDGTGRQYRAILESGSRDEELGALSVPTLVIHGSADTLIQPDGGRHTAEVIPGARYVEIDGFGHDLAPSRWAILADTVTAFVADLESPG